MGRISQHLMRFLDELTVALAPLFAGRSAQRRWVLVQCDDDFDCYQVNGQNTSLVARGTPEELATRVKGQPVELRLSSAQIVRNLLTLPATSRQFLEPVIRHQLDRLTPWAADRVAFDYAVADGLETGSGQIRVSVVTTSLDMLNQVLARFAGSGVRPVCVGVDDEPLDRPSSVNLRAETGQEAHAALRRRIAISLIALLMCGGALAAYTTWQLATMQAHADAVDAALAERRAIVMAAVDHSANDQSGHPLLAAKTELRPMVVILNELSERLPDDTYLTELTIEESQLHLRGLSRDASQLIALLEGSDSLEDVAFAAPLTRSDESQRDSFQLEATLLARGSGG